ncbi:unnamed protein product, partial [Urochloa humidicola]
ICKKTPPRPLSPRRRRLARLRPRLVLPGSSDGSARVVGSKAGKRRRLGSAARVREGFRFLPRSGPIVAVGTEGDGGGGDASSTQGGSGAQGRCGADAEGCSGGDAAMPKAATAPVRKDAAATPPRIRDSLCEGRSEAVLARDRYISATPLASAATPCVLVTSADGG